MILVPGKWVLIEYDNQEYPEVMAVSEDGADVSVMTPTSPPNHFKWPSKPDCIFYSNENVLGEIEPLVVLNNRGVYK